jgi:hypothetical protein
MEEWKRPRTPERVAQGFLFPMAGAAVALVASRAAGGMLLPNAFGGGFAGRLGNLSKGIGIVTFEMGMQIGLYQCLIHSQRKPPSWDFSTEAKYGGAALCGGAAFFFTRSIWRRTPVGAKDIAVQALKAACATGAVLPCYYHFSSLRAAFSGNIGTDNIPQDLLAVSLACAAVVAICPVGALALPTLAMPTWKSTFGLRFAEAMLFYCLVFSGIEMLEEVYQK